MMMFNRSRPWRARGPSLGSRAGSRRRGCLDNTPPSFPPSFNQTDGYEERIALSYAAADVAPVDSAPATRSPSTEQVVARIDEAGLRAMAWRDQKQPPVTGECSEIQAAEGIVNSPLDLFIPTRSDLQVISRSRRSA